MPATRPGDAVALAEVALPGVDDLRQPGVFAHRLNGAFLVPVEVRVRHQSFELLMTRFDRLEFVGKRICHGVYSSSVLPVGTQKPEQTPDDAAGDVRELGHRILSDRIDHFLREVQNHDQNERERDLALPDIGE